MRFVLLVVGLVGLATAAWAGEYETNSEWCSDYNAGPDLRIGACTWLLNSGRLREASYAVAYINRGIAYNDKGAHDRAIRDLDQAIALKPDYAAAYNNRGNAYRNTGAYDRAIRDYDQAIALKPDYAAAYNNRGIAYDDKGAHDRAIRDLDHAIALKPDYALAYMNRGNAYYNKGAHDRAIRDYDRAIALDPDFALAYNNRGFAYSEKGAYDRAIRDYDRVIALVPDDADAYNGKAWLLATARDAGIRDGNEAVRLSRRAVRLHDSANNRDTLAAAHAEAGRFADAVKSQGTAIAKLRAEGRAGDIADYRSRLDLYRAGRPYRDK